MTIEHTDLIPGVTKVRLVRLSEMQQIRADLDAREQIRFGYLPKVGEIGIVGPSYNLRDSYVPVLFGEGYAASILAENESECRFDTLEIIENPPRMEPFPIGTKVKLVKADPRHLGAGSAIPMVGLIGTIDAQTAPAWCQTVAFKATDLGYDSRDGNDDDTACLYILRNCLEPHLSVEDTLHAMVAALGERPKVDQDEDEDEPKVDPEALIDARGHWMKTEPFLRSTMEKWSGKHFDDNVTRSMLFEKIDMEEHGEVKEETKRLFSRTSECFVCQGNFGYTASEGGKRFTASTECQYPGGIPDYDVLLGVPSGRIVFANDLRPLVEIEEPRGTTVNSMIGQRRNTEAHAASGLIMIATGNTCPDIWRRPDGSISIANFRDPDPEDDGEFEEVGVVTPVEERGVELGSICTDLWDFCAMDYGYFVNRCAALDEDQSNFDITIVDVKAGTWAFTVPKDIGRDTATELFSTGRWTDLPAPEIHLPDTSVADTLLESQAWKALKNTWASPISSNGHKGVEFLLICYGTGYDWTDGLLRTGTRREDTPFRELTDAMLDQPQVVHPLDQQVPVWPNFAYPKGEAFLGQKPGVSTMYPLALGYAGVSTIPQSVDPWWLALSLMYMKAMKDRTDLFMDRHGYTPEKSKAGMNLIFSMLLDLVETRGGIDWIRPYLGEWLKMDQQLLQNNPPDA